MNNFPQIRDISIDDYILEIKNCLDNKNFLSALSVALMIPDICRKIIGDELSYQDWFNKYVFNKFYNIPKIEDIDKNDESYELYEIKLNGDVCYALRNSILHSGTSHISFRKKGQKERAKIDRIELCVNGKSNLNNQYGELISIQRFDETEKVISIRINIVNLVINILKGYEIFKKENNNTHLFMLIDWDKKDGTIVFTPNEYIKRLHNQ